MTVKYRCFTIILNETKKDMWTYKVTRDDGSIIEHEDAEGFAVTMEETKEMAKETIDSFIED